MAALPQPSPTIAQCLNGGYGWLEVKCHRCEKRVSIPLKDVRRRRDTEIWKLGVGLPLPKLLDTAVQTAGALIKLTQRREVELAPWYHPSEGDGHDACRRKPIKGPCGVRACRH